MYAVIKTGGKQYKVAVGEKLKEEQIPADIDAEITLDQVLAVGEGESRNFRGAGSACTAFLAIRPMPPTSERAQT